MQLSLKKGIGIGIGLGLAVVAFISIYVISVLSDLPKMITLDDYQPRVVSEVYDRNGIKIGEYKREKRQIATVEEIPEKLKQAFIASEDSDFYEHSGINIIAIFRAALANLKAGRKVQGASTITQQVARSLLLSNEKTYKRKIKEIILASRMERNLSKEDILYLYLNQIYLGHGAYGVKEAAEVYFRKPLKDLTLAECALLGGLPQAPSRYYPGKKPKLAKNRQLYVLRRMKDEGFISEEEETTAKNAPLKFYVRKNYQKDAPYYLETLRQILVDELGDDMVHHQGLKIYTGLDIEKQREAQKQVREGLRSLDKRQGYRGPIKNISDINEIQQFLLETRDNLIDQATDERVLNPDGTLPQKGDLNLSDVNNEGKPRPNLPSYVELDQIIEGIVNRVDDQWGLVYVKFAESKGLIDIESMKWARKPNPEIRFDYDEVEKPSKVLKVGDVIQIRAVGRKFYSSRINKELSELKQNTRRQKKEYIRPAELPDFDLFVHLELEQIPETQGALLSFDQNSADIVAMVGGYNFHDLETLDGTLLEKGQKWNRTFQAARQTGSSFKSLVYASALDKGFTPATPISGAPLVFEDEKKEATPVEETEEGGSDSGDEAKKWKPTNYSKRFMGDILFRNALIRSLNIPTVRIEEKIGIDWVASYARRLGIFSPLNMDMTLALGSSGVTLYEMTKVFSQFGRMGKKIVPVLIHKVEDRTGKVLMENVSLDVKFAKELSQLNDLFEERRKKYLFYQSRMEKGIEMEEIHKEFSEAFAKNTENEDGEDKDNSWIQNILKPFKFEVEPPLYFNQKAQLIKPTTAYIITSLLQGVIEEPHGTGRRARSLGRPVAGKTGTTNNEYDAWFVGYTPDYVSGVWVGYDQEKSLGRGEGGGRTALPIWLEYMKEAHKNLPPKSFPVPEGIVFVNIDNETGKLASNESESVVRQAFLEGSEPKIVQTQEEKEATKTEELQDFYKQDLAQ